MGKNGQNERAHRSRESFDQVSRSERLTVFEIAFLIICAAIFISLNAWEYINRTADTKDNSTSFVIQSNYDISVLNEATYDDLISVKGIGDAKATAILNYRGLLGGFTSPEQLIDISGIGEKVYAEIINHFYGEESLKEE